MLANANNGNGRAAKLKNSQIEKWMASLYPFMFSHCFRRTFFSLSLHITNGRRKNENKNRCQSTMMMIRHSVLFIYVIFFPLLLTSFAVLLLSLSFGLIDLPARFLSLSSIFVYFLFLVLRFVLANLVGVVDGSSNVTNAFTQCTNTEQTHPHIPSGRGEKKRRSKNAHQFVWKLRAAHCYHFEWSRRRTKIV